MSMSEALIGLRHRSIMTLVRTSRIYPTAFGSALNSAHARHSNLILLFRRSDSWVGRRSTDKQGLQALKLHGLKPTKAQICTSRLKSRPLRSQGQSGDFQNWTVLRITAYVGLDRNCR